jgi:flavin-dependent dehydrogenase
VITIIGASTSGLFCAYLLAKAGLKVALFEKQKTLGPPERTLIVTPKTNEVLGFVPQKAIINYIQKIELFSRNRTTQILLKEPELVFEREKLINFLAQKAKRAGARIETGHKFCGTKKEKDKLILKLMKIKNQKLEVIKTDILIGANGVNSCVGRKLGISSKNMLALIQAKVNHVGDSQKIQIWFDTKKTKYFFWLIPEGPKTAAIGLIDETPKKAERNLKIFLKERGVRPRSFQSGVVPFYRPNLKISNQNIFLIGDAKSQVKNTTVGGTVTGLRGAKAAAEAIIQNRNYSKSLKKLKRELFLHYLLRQVLNKFTNHDYDVLLALLDEKTKKILTQYTRDEAVSGALKLLLAQPKLLSFTKKLF